MSLAYDEFMANLEEEEAMGKRQWTLEVVSLGRPMPWGKVHRYGTHSIETNLDDARLIAAAPDLLAALLAYADQVCECDGSEPNPRLCLAHTAIRKATGNA